MISVKLNDMAWKSMVFLAFPFLFMADVPRRQVPLDWRMTLTGHSVNRDWGNVVIRQEGDIELCYVAARLDRAPLEIVPVSYFSGNRPETASLAQLVERFRFETKRPVLAAINGGFFDVKTRLPIGFLLRDGEMDFFNMPQNVRRSMVGFTADPERSNVVMATPKDMPKAWLDLADARSGGHVRSLPVHHINVPGGRHAFTLYTQRFGSELPAIREGIYLIAEKEPGSQRGRWYTVQTAQRPGALTRIPKNGLVIALHGDSQKLASLFKPGMRVRPHWTLPADWSTRRVVHGLLAGPRLLQEGHTRVSAEEEKLAHLRSRDRMALGVNARGELILLWAHRKTSGTNLAFDEVARLMKSLGASEAIALDGGSSRAVWSDDFSFNGRPIANALMLAIRKPA